MPFRDVLGHRRLLEVLARSVQRGSLPPSLILAGPGGVGKRRVAVALAQALNCTDLQSAPLTRTADICLDACGICPACQRIARGVHPDVTIIEPGDTGVIKVDPIRDVVDRAAYRPFEGRRRVVIFDDADALMPSAQNALLKTLEEPPASAVFLLVTSRPDALLPTVRSRCPLLRFGALGAGEIVAALVASGRSEADARAIAATAEGSIGRALDASTGGLVESRDVAARVLARVASGDDPKRRLDGAKDLLAGTGSGGASDRELLAGHLRAMSALLRDVELLAAGSDARGLANPDARSDIEALKAFDGDRGLRAFAAVDCALAALERNASSKIVADWLLLQL